LCWKNAKYFLPAIRQFASPSCELFHQKQHRFFSTGAVFFLAIDFYKTIFFELLLNFKQVFHMEKRVLLFIAVLATFACAAPDYFPLEKGNMWTFLFFSSSSAVIPNPPVTHDTGAISWEVLASVPAGGKNEYPMREVRNLIRRYQTGSQPYDSVFSPPRVTVDTLIFTQTPLANDLSFKDATCACMVHNPALPLPSGLTIKDTAVLYGQGTVNAVKIIPTACSCSKSMLWTFCAAQSTGPVELYLTRCNIVGTSFHETRKLISREYPTGVQTKGAETQQPEMGRISVVSRQIVCRFSTVAPGKTTMILCDAQGRIIQHYVFPNLNVGTPEVRFPLSSIRCGIAVLFLQSAGAPTCKKLIVMQ
jgi:hypothetical protein